jgi:phage baseplate assembly protein W
MTPSLNFSFPYAIGADGRTATDTVETHVRNMIEQLLLTNPGERVNRPDFGGGAFQLIFAPNSAELAATLQLTLQASLQRYLADILIVEKFAITAEDEKLLVVLNYVLRQTGEAATAQVELAQGGG